MLMKSHLGYKKEQKYSLKSSEHAAAGALGSFVARAIVQPFDVLKIRFQLQVEPTYGKNAGLYHGMIQAIRTIVSHEGITAMWKGHVAGQILTITYGSTQFWSYSLFTHGASRLNLGEGGLAQTVCGGLAGMMGTIVSMPCDVARTRVVAQSSLKYQGIFDVWRKVFVHEGISGLWRGLLPALAMTMPFTAIQFRFYQIFLNITSKVFAQENNYIVGLSSTAVSGGAAGVIAKMVVYPLDVLKKRMQLRGAETTREQFGKIVIYKNSFDCMVRLTKEEGLTAWYKGLGPSLIKSAIFSSLIFTTYESTCKLICYFNSQNNNNNNNNNDYDDIS